MLIGVLSLQGDAEEHVAVMKRLVKRCIVVNSLETLNLVDALVIPGGESTAIRWLLTELSLLKTLRDKLQREQLAVFGTCAGAILLSSTTNEKEQNLDVLDMVVQRNYYGSQLHSFSTKLKFRPYNKEIECDFIRAPSIVECGPHIEILAEYQGKPIIVRQNRMLASTCHTENKDELSLHRYFLSII
jgi:5'-phosphate synthase pdxT subunit